MNSLFPIFLKLAGRRCLVVGAGKVAEQKIAGLLEAGALVRVVALRASEPVRAWAIEKKIELEVRAYAPGDLAGNFLVVVAAGSPLLNEFIYREAQRQGILCNVVDVPELCDFYYPAVVQRGDLQIAISTNGQSPSLAQKLRQQLEGQFGPGYARWVKELGETRRLVLASDLDPATKSDLLHSLASAEAFEAAIEKQAKIAQARHKASDEEFENEGKVTV